MASYFFLKLEADFFDPMLSRKTFATNSLKQTFVWDVWFHHQIVYTNIEHPSIINRKIADFYMTVI